MDPATHGPSNLFLLASVPESSPDFDIGDPELVAMLENSQRTHFWFRARNLRILDFLEREGIPPPARVLEIGCGTGTVLSALSRAGYRMTGIEMHGRLARRAAEENPASRIYSLEIRRAPEAFVRQEPPFDAVGLFDVVEHAADPETLLRSCAERLRPGGALVGTVPAMPALWSDYDAYSGHRLRFTRRALLSLFARAGLPRPRAAYFFQALVPGMLARRLLIGRRGAADETRRRAAQHTALDPPAGFASALLERACALERRIAGSLPLGRVPGASLWFCARIDRPDGFSEGSRSRERTGGRP
jgi:SAM-dependent methyltransferase